MSLIFRISLNQNNCTFLWLQGVDTIVSSHDYVLHS